MGKVLVPFAHPTDGERAVRWLLAHTPKSEALEVELCVIVDPLTPGKVAIYLSPERAEALARDAAVRWIEELGALLVSAGIPYRWEVKVGRVSRQIKAAMRRSDVDRVLVPARVPRWLSAFRAAKRSGELTLATGHPVTVLP